MSIKFTIGNSKKRECSDRFRKNVYKYTVREMKISNINKKKKLK